MGILPLLSRTTGIRRAPNEQWRLQQEAPDDAQLRAWERTLTTMHDLGVELLLGE
jgi:hypothetical protein